MSLREISEGDNIEIDNANHGANLVGGQKRKERDVESTIVSSISKKIGRGEDAKNSIIWTIITWCLTIPSVITILYFLTMWGVIYQNYNDNAEHIFQIRENILKIWGLFSPIITLALGYLYGSRNNMER